MAQLKIKYSKYIADSINLLPYGTPIYTYEIANNLIREFNINLNQAKAIVNVNLKRHVDNQKLERFQRGIYYKAQQTLFGKTKLNPNSMATKIYINRNNEIIGYETGPSFLNKVGLTTQNARNKYFATNFYQPNGCRVDKKLNVVIRKPPIKVTADNYKYLQLLDAIENKDNIAIDANCPEKVILNYIEKNNLDLIRLVYLARKYYKHEVLLRVIDIVAIEEVK
jgi:hypothetical protein